MILISEPEFHNKLEMTLNSFPFKVGAVTGPGRSGAVAAVYVSHMLGVPFIPFGQPCPDKLRPLLIADTTMKTGRTMRKACAKYAELEPYMLFVFSEPTVRYKFWYEK